MESISSHPLYERIRKAVWVAYSMKSAKSSCAHLWKKWLHHVQTSLVTLQGQSSVQALCSVLKVVLYHQLFWKLIATWSADRRFCLFPSVPFHLLTSYNVPRILRTSCTFRRQRSFCAIWNDILWHFWLEYCMSVCSNVKASMSPWTRALLELRKAVAVHLQIYS